MDDIEKYKWECPQCQTQFQGAYTVYDGVCRGCFSRRIQVQVILNIANGSLTVKDCQKCVYANRPTTWNTNICKLGLAMPCLYLAKIIHNFDCDYYEEYIPKDEYLYG